MFVSITCSRFTLIVDNTICSSESCDFVDHQMVADIIGRHTGELHQINTDALLSYSDFEQVRTYACMHYICTHVTLM